MDDNDSTVLNACFVLDRTHHAPTHAGIERAAVTTWARDSTGTIRTTLFQSPDAGYVASFVVDQGSISGTGRSWLAPERGVFPRDFISGRRIGPPDRERCVRGIEAEAARQQARRSVSRRAPGHPEAPRPPAAFRPSSDPLVSLLSALLARDRVLREVGGDGPWAFDPRVIRVSWGRAPQGWPDSVSLRWIGDVRDSRVAPEKLSALLTELNGARENPPNWLVCGTGGDARACSLAAFPSVVAASEPWIQGDRAQVVVYVKHRPEFDFGSNVWYANVIHLRRADGVWRPAASYNLAGN